MFTDDPHNVPSIHKEWLQHVILTYKTQNANFILSFYVKCMDVSGTRRKSLIDKLYCQFDPFMDQLHFNHIALSILMFFVNVRCNVIYTVQIYFLSSAFDPKFDPIL